MRAVAPGWGRLLHAARVGGVAVVETACGRVLPAGCVPAGRHWAVSCPACLATEI